MRYLLFYSQIESQTSHEVEIQMVKQELLSQENEKMRKMQQEMVSLSFIKTKQNTSRDINPQVIGLQELSIKLLFNV